MYIVHCAKNVELDQDSNLQSPTVCIVLYSLCWLYRIDESLCRVDDSVETEDPTLIPYDRSDTRATEAGQ